MYDGNVSRPGFDINDRIVIPKPFYFIPRNIRAHHSLFKDKSNCFMCVHNILPKQLRVTVIIEIVVGQYVIGTRWIIQLFGGMKQYAIAFINNIIMTYSTVVAQQ